MSAFNRHDLVIPKTEILLDRESCFGDWHGSFEVFNRNPIVHVGVVIASHSENGSYAYKFLGESSCLLKPSGNSEDSHQFKFTLLFQTDSDRAVNADGVSADKIEWFVEIGRSVPLQPIKVTYGNVVNSLDWKARVRRFHPYNKEVKVAIPSLPFNKRRTIMIPEPADTHTRLHLTHDVLLERSMTSEHMEDRLGKGIRELLQIKDFTSFEPRANTIFRSSVNPSRPYNPGDAVLSTYRYIEFRQESRMFLKRGTKFFKPWIGEIAMKNTADNHYLVYKVRSTAPNSYLVMPTEGVLQPKLRRQLHSEKYRISTYGNVKDQLKNMQANNDTFNSNVNNAIDVNSGFAQMEEKNNNINIMMDKKFFRGTIQREVLYKQGTCDSHRFAEAMTFAAESRDQETDGAAEEKTDAVCIKFLYTGMLPQTRPIDPNLQVSKGRQRFEAAQFNCSNNVDKEAGGMENSEASSGTRVTSESSETGQQKVKFGQSRKDSKAERPKWVKNLRDDNIENLTDGRNMNQTHVFLLDVVFVDPFAVNEKNYNVEELFRHAETLTGGYKMSRCFYPYFIPDDMNCGPVLVCPKTNLVVDRKHGSIHSHWLTEIYLINVYSHSLYFYIVPQEENSGYITIGDEIVVFPRQGKLQSSLNNGKGGRRGVKISDVLCERIQIYFRYCKFSSVENGAIFKLHIFFFTESTAPPWIEENIEFDTNNPEYRNPLKDALDVKTVRVFVSDSGQKQAGLSESVLDELDEKYDIFNSLRDKNEACDSKQSDFAINMDKVFEERDCYRNKANL